MTTSVVSEDCRPSGSLLPDEAKRLQVQSLLSKRDRQNDYGLFTDFYMEYMPHIVSHLIANQALSADAVEVAQETFMAAYKVWESIDHPKAWTQVVAARKYAQFISKVNNLKEQPLHEGHSELLPDGSDAIQDMVERSAIVQLLAQLPRRQGQVFELNLQGFNNQQIAAALKMSEGAVRNALFQARRAASKWMTRQQKDELS